MSIQAVVPTIPGREQLLAETVASLERHDIDPVVVRNSPSCGEGWAIGLEACSADYVLLAAHDIEIRDVSGLQTALARADAGLVVSPVIFNPDGSLQGAGGFGLRLEDGALARTAIFPLALRNTFALLAPWPHSHHHCDTWISECAWRLGRGPVVVHGFEIVHKVISETRDGEHGAYDTWRTQRLRALSNSDRRPPHDTVAALRAHEGRSITVAGARARARTELRLLSAGAPRYLETVPERSIGGLRRALHITREESAVADRARHVPARLAFVRWRAMSPVRRAVGWGRSTFAVRTRVRRLAGRASKTQQD